MDPARHRPVIKKVLQPMKLPSSQAVTRRRRTERSTPSFGRQERLADGGYDAIPDLEAARIRSRFTELR